MGDRERERGHQAGAARLRGARVAAVATDVAHPGRAPEGVDATGEALAGREAGLRRELGEDAHLAIGLRVPGAGAAQHAVARRAPDDAAAPAERVAERRQHARGELVRRQAGGDRVGDRLLGEQQPVRAADAPAQPRGVERARERGGQLRGIGHDGHVGVEPADDRGEVARAHARRDGEEGEVGIGEPHERERLARRDRAGAVARVEHGLPVAPLQRRRELVGAVGVLGLHLPAGLRERALEQPPVRRRDVDEQRAQRPVRLHTLSIGLRAPALERRERLSRGPCARRAGARSSPRR